MKVIHKNIEHHVDYYIIRYHTYAVIFNPETKEKHHIYEYDLGIMTEWVAGSWIIVNNWYIVRPTGSKEWLLQPSSHGNQVKLIEDIIERNR